jgi:hypothetical protein
MPKRKKRAPAKVAAKAQGDRFTYRELRNTPGRVWERLANDEPLTLVADGEAKAVVIPVNDGDVATVMEAYRRGRAMLALRRIRQEAVRNGTASMTLAQINTVIREVRAEKRIVARGR